MTDAWEIIRFGISAALTLAGLFVLVTGVVGVFRFRYALSRIHAAALLDTLGCHPSTEKLRAILEQLNDRECG